MVSVIYHQESGEKIIKRIFISRVRTSWVESYQEDFIQPAAEVWSGDKLIGRGYQEDFFSFSEAGGELVSLKDYQEDFLRGIC